MTNKPMMVESPYVIMFKVEGGVQCHLYDIDGFGYRGFGLLVCDLVRHVSRAFKVDEDAVWEWVDKEREHPTTELRSPS